ncbi:MAG: M56 family metallopeptidase [bacterium]|nr:M56 family metallopeptidase [bacterium]
MSAWATGFILLLVPLVRGIRQRQVLARSALPVESEAWNEQLAELTERLAARRAPRLLISPKITVPMTWGSLRPVILLPEDADCWPASRRRDVLLHELAHIRRHDALTRIWSQLACALYWFDPLVWWAAHRLRVESEHACDDRVLSAGSRASDYADHLLAAARTARGRLPVAAVAMARPSPLSGRVFAILDEKRDRAPLTATRLLVSCLTASVLALPLAAAAPQPPEPPAAPEAPEPETAPVAPRAPKAPLPPEPPAAPEAPEPEAAPVPAPAPEAPLPPEAPRTYLEELLEQAEPSTGELARALRLAGSEIGSDHELSELLRLVSSRELNDRGALLAYVLATRSIGSDHALARALQLLLERELEAEVLDAVLTSASTIGSDHELAELLIELTARGIEPTETFFEVLDTVDSEHERERVLATIGE